MESTDQTQLAAQANALERSEFLQKTYYHLACSILAFLVLEAILLASPLAPLAAKFMTGGYTWLIVLGLFMGVSYVADMWAKNSESIQMQYAGLGLYIAAEAVLFLPMLYIAKMYAPDVIPKAGIMTALLFGGLTLFAFTSKKDFSFLGGMLRVGGFIALGFIVASIVFGFSLGLIFSAVMIVFAAGSILYSTSQMLHQYHTGQYVAASLSLFASVALLFWYLIQFFMSLSEE